MKPEQSCLIGFVPTLLPLVRVVVVMLFPVL